MASDAPTNQSLGVVNLATGDSTGAGAVIDITCGFTPRHVIVWNQTDAIRWEKFAAQAAANSVKQVTGGTLTADTSSGIVIKGQTDGDTYRGFQLSAALAANGKALHWAAWG